MPYLLCVHVWTMMHNSASEMVCSFIVNKSLFRKTNYRHSVVRISHGLGVPNTASVEFDDRRQNHFES